MNRRDKSYIQQESLLKNLILRRILFFIYDKIGLFQPIEGRCKGL